MLPEIDRLLLIWRRTVRPPTRRLGGALAASVVFGAAHLARVGTPAARAAAAGLLVAAVGAAVVVALVQRRRTRSLRWALRRVVGAADPEAASRIERALGLTERARADATMGSVELADLHLRRQLGRVSADAVRAAAERHASRLQRAALGVAVVAAGLVLYRLEPFRLLEGLDVLGARQREAPLPLPYLRDLRVEVQPPEYLREKPRSHVEPHELSAPYGSLLTVRGAPLHAQRQLVLTDGTSEVPFVDDGSGHVAARWPLKAGVALGVAARLGEVRVPQGDKIQVQSIPDLPPQVSVEGAPRTLKILEMGELAVLYRASDDHGLRQVDLVLRAGSAEERRVLSRLDGDSRHDQGGYQLRDADAFLRKAYLPVEVTVEARDNDPLTGPKWGRSAPILLLPPAIGEPESMRHRAMVAARDALVDLLASELAVSDKLRGAELEAQQQAWLGPVRTAFAALTGGSFGGLRVPRRTGMFVEGQLRKVSEVLVAERRAPGARGHATAVKAIEGVVLAVDRVTLALGTRDAQSVAKRLSRVALDTADQLGRVRQGQATAADGKQRTEAAMQVLAPSGQALSTLGQLGEDLGSIVANDLRRLRRALAADDLRHAELVLLDLGLRLRKANPSFAGGAGGTGEGGGGGQASADEAADGEGQGGDGESDEASFDAERQAMQELMRDHAGNLESSQQAMRQAAEQAQPDGFLDEAKEHARAVRKALDALPRDLDESGARQQGERMAEALERGDLREALDAAAAAEQRLREGAQESRQPDDPLGRLIAERLDETGRRLAPERRWTEETLQKLRQATRADLKGVGEREKQLADRARQVIEQGQGQQGTLPPQLLDHLKQAEQEMREATRAMQQGQNDEALDHQRRAQHHLDSSHVEDEAPQQPPPGDRDDARGRAPSGGQTAIPRPDEHQGPAEFRRRVSEGLKQGQSPALRDAIRRYAERLMK